VLPHGTEKSGSDGALLTLPVRPVPRSLVATGNFPEKTMSAILWGEFPL